MKILLISLLFITNSFAQARGGRNAQYREVFHYLLENHTQINRSIKFLPDGVETLTTSVDPKITPYIQKHVEQMKYLVESGKPIRRWDPLFEAIFDHHSLIHMDIKRTPQGIQVVETSQDPMVADLIKAHAQVVSLFVKHGFTEAHRSHPVP